MFARTEQPPIFAPEGLSWDFPSRADRGLDTVPEPGRLGGAPAGNRRARFAPAARQAASAAKGAVQGAAAIARELLLLADPELEARADELARAEDSSGSRAGIPTGAGCTGARSEALRIPALPRTPRRPGMPARALDTHRCLTPRD